LYAKVRKPSVTARHIERIEDNWRMEDNT
jgi:hypothetical protein